MGKLKSGWMLDDSLEVVKNQLSAGVDACRFNGVSMRYEITKEPSFNYSHNGGRYTSYSFDVFVGEFSFSFFVSHIVEFEFASGKDTVSIVKPREKITSGADTYYMTYDEFDAYSTVMYLLRPVILNIRGEMHEILIKAQNISIYGEDKR